MKVRKAIITAAGFGSRFLPITKTIPKEMLPIVDKPIIHWIVKECADAGLEEIIIVAAPDEVKIFEDYFYGHAENIRLMMQLQNKMDRWNKVTSIFELPKVKIIPENRTMPYGNGRPILTAKELVEKEEAFVVCWGDDLVLSEVSAVKQVVEAFEQDVCDGVLAVQEMPIEEMSKYGVVKIKEGTEDEIEKVIEKPEPENCPSNLAEFGRFVLTPKIFDYLNPTAIGKDGEIWLIDSADKVAEHGKLKFKRIEGTWYTTGDPKRYLQAQIAFSDKYLG